MSKRLSDPHVLVKVHWFLAVVWFLMAPIMLYFGWQNSIAFLAWVSVYANFVGHWSSAQAARVEVKQVEAEEAD